ncbi:hypothetical protein MIND_00965400 [Mycena indigotica]|uniref:F-box domain-containing protein n=1 Tax=Mycena indigotica TaxID=2126181 RepID=A0A8H6SD35_9AGAR|nr:uncharacterized protein MIND_00965400 [Mycena indigotica]KAF7297321.1 hypothetical protein MIND_00965400 [Mycena indigotica]
MPSDLPQEIINTIIGHIPTSDASTLKASAAVCSSFHDPSRRKLFNTLRLYRARSLQRPTLEEGAELFDSSPSISAYVRDVVLEVSDATEDCVALEKILNRLVADGLLERLVINGRGARWNIVAKALPTLPEALFAAMNLSSLTRLHLMHLRNVPSNLFSTALGLPIVSFHQVSLRRNTAFVPGETPSRVGHLIIADSVTDSATPILQSLFSSPPPSLKRLEVRLAQAEDNYEKRLLKMCSDTLEELVINTGELTRQPSYLFPTFSHLHTLNIKLFVNRHRKLPDLLLPTISLCTLNSCPVLQTLILRFIVEPRFPKAEKAWTITESASGGIPARAIRCVLVLRDIAAGPEPRDDSELYEKFETAMEELFVGREGVSCELAPPQGFYLDQLP